MSQLIADVMGSTESGPFCGAEGLVGKHREVEIYPEVRWTQPAMCTN